MKFKIAIGGCVILLCFFLTLYLVTFHEGLSVDSSNWGDFGSYIGGVCGVIISLMAIWISYRIAIYTQRSSKIDEYMINIMERNDRINVLIEELQKNENDIKEHNKKPLLNKALSLQNGGVDVVLKKMEDRNIAIKSKIKAELFIIKRNTNICLNHFLFKYPDASELMESLNKLELMESDGVRNVYIKVGKMIEYYFGQMV